MPLAPTVMSTQMRLKGNTLTISGDKFQSFVTAVSNATAQYIISASTVNSTNIALGPGAGTFNGRISGLSSTTMANLMRVKASTYLLSGRDIKKLLDSVAFGVVQAMKSVVVQGTVIGAGPGSGNARIAGLSPTALEGLIITQMSVKLLSGSKMRKLVSAIAFGICSHIMSAGTIITTCIGAAAGPPTGPVTIPAAPGPGRLA